MLDSSIFYLGKAIRAEVQHWIWLNDNSEINPDNLFGGCAIASYTLYKALIKLGHQPKFIMRENDCTSHCWVELNDHVIDLTATQFNMSLPKVLITKRDDYFKSIPELIKYTDKFCNRGAVRIVNQWYEQSPSTYYKQIRKFLKNLNVKFHL